MRVITGTARGRKLMEPKGMDIRPTTDMVKESVFNIAQFDIEGRRILDLFAGTGQMGIEALSRGAKSVTFVDASKDAVKLVKDNLSHCGMEAAVVHGDSLSFLERCGKFDFIFLDPPYATDLIDRALEKIIKFDILSESGIIIYETVREKKVLPLEAPYFVGREYNYGKVKLVVCGRQA